MPRGPILGAREAPPGTSPPLTRIYTATPMHPAVSSAAQLHALRRRVALLEDRAETRGISGPQGRASAALCAQVLQTIAPDR